MTAAFGTPVKFNEGTSAQDAWAVGFAVLTPTDNPGAYDYFGGNYPATPGDGQVLVFYAGLVENTGPTWASAYATEGTGPGQYQVLA